MIPSEWAFAQSVNGNKMVRVGPILDVTKVKGHWTVPQYGFVAEAFWPFISDFVSPIPSPPPGAPPVGEITPTWDAIPYAQDIDRRLRMTPDRTMFWKFEAGSPDTTKEHVQLTAVLGHGNIVRWSWLDAFVGRPFLRACAWFANLFT